MCLSAVGAVQVNQRTKVTVFLLEQYYNLVGVLKYVTCSIVSDIYLV